LEDVCDGSSSQEATKQNHPITQIMLNIKVKWPTVVWSSGIKVTT
jgi:hypothetical protein